MAKFGDLSPEQWLRIQDGFMRYKEQGHNDPHDPEVDYWQSYREKIAADNLMRWGAYQNFLVGQLGSYMENPDTHWDDISPIQLADYVMDQLFVWKRGEGDSNCICSCHPKVGEGDLHDFGFACNCLKSPEERAESWKKWQETISNDPALQEWHNDLDEQDEEVKAFEATEPGLRDLSMLSMACPEQWQGILDNRPFYFRERHGKWRLEVGEPLAKGTSPPTMEDTEHRKGFGHYYDSDLFDVIGEGVEEDYGPRKADHVQFIVRTIRDWVIKKNCSADHINLAGKVVGQMVYRYCPECGERIE